MEHYQVTLSTYMAIRAERDAAIQERNMAIEERKRALSERDMAMLQRDAAIAERNSALQERDEAIAVLRYQESSINDNNVISDSAGNGVVHEAQQVHDQQPVGGMPYMVEAAFSSREVPTSNAFQTTGVAIGASKPKKVKKKKESEAKSIESAKPPRIGRKRSENPSNQTSAATSIGQNNEQGLGSNEDLDRELALWKENLGLNQINFDDSAMPVPVCSCTGMLQPCYKWGNGGWQSACCTTTMSMYPLPPSSSKRYSRVGGRKMSGSVFTKLLNRLAAEGHDLSIPIDLKDHWAKHGTNRYNTIK